MKLHLLFLPFLLLSAAPASAKMGLCEAVFHERTAPQSPIFDDLLIEPLRKDDRLSDFADDFVNERFGKISLRPEANAEQRLAAISGLSLAEITAAPGHRKLRDPGQIGRLEKYIRESGGGDFSKDPLILNVITGKDGRVTDIDLWNGHHRFVAYMKADYRTLGQLPKSAFRILIDGRTENGEKWDHFVPAGGLDFNGGFEARAIPKEWGVDPGTMAVEGSVSNRRMGSRSTMGRVFKNTFESKEPKVGVYFGTFDPVHEGHVAVALAALKKHGFDEVVLIPNYSPLHKPNATAIADRLRMTALRVARDPGLNLYVGRSDRLIEPFGNDPVIERISQIYGTREVYQLIGTDSYEKLMGLGQITPQTKGRFLVFAREKGETIRVPEELKEKISWDGEPPVGGLSSTKIREALKKGEAPPASQMHPVVSDYIRQRGLYQTH